MVENVSVVFEGVTHEVTPPLTDFDLGSDDRECKRGSACCVLGSRC
jgi:hypothetical protein